MGLLEELKITLTTDEKIPELYASYVEEGEMRAYCIGHFKIYPLSIRTKLEKLRPLYIAQMANRIQQGPDFDGKISLDLGDMYRINEWVPNTLDMCNIIGTLETRGVLKHALPGFEKVQTFRGPDWYSRYTKQTQS
jgi:hypothetical protein